VLGGEAGALIGAVNDFRRFRPARADIDKDTTVLEMGVEIGAGRVFETATPALMVDQMLDRDIVK